MKRGRLALLVISCLVGVAIIATSNITVPQLVRIALGVATVFAVPGFVLICAVLPAKRLASSERLLASIGTSLSMSICAAVFLAATPIGLTRMSFGAVLGGCTIILSMIAFFKALVGRNLLWGSESTTKGSVLLKAPIDS